ncbi:MAG: 3-methyl-2-oxobutanoate dehydrogenase subunit VorB [Candidatus Omnitrophica bacterium]|nr:3-methyl-2-oxobutanoate dehydrogenase subunit VorB [Candidatus Omnitrophota bacterium]
MKIKYLTTGNEACAEAAIRAGCRFYAGYPITPQNELIAYMSKRLEEIGGVFIQSESEIAAINMVLGASATGARAMTSSSSPGISLKQEGISYMAGCELPAVIVNVMRGGPGLGNISGAQSDYFQATKGGGHGDYRLIVLAPAAIQEMFDLTYEAFAIAEKYRNPVMIFADGIIGQMMEPLEFDKGIKPSGVTEKNWTMTGAKDRPPRCIKSLFMKEGALEKHNINLQEKYCRISKNETRFEEFETKDADVILVGYGTTSRILRSCVPLLREEGIKAGLIRPITLWPFPYNALSRYAKKNVKFITVEMNAGQMVEDIRLAVQDDTKVHFYGRMGGGIPTEEEIIKFIKKISI